MNLEDIREIVRIQLSDLGIEATDEHYNVANQYYIMNHAIPDVQYILSRTMPNFQQNFQQIFQNILQNLQPGNIINIQYIIDPIVENLQIHDNVKHVVEDLDQIPLKIIHNGEDSKTYLNTECPICCETFVESDLVRILPCRHMMHRICIDDYLIKESYLCPLCRQPAGKHKVII